MITFKAGNLFKEPCLDGLAHGVNCQGVMGAGIAVPFRKQFPQMYEEYRALCLKGLLKPGMCFCWNEPPVVVFNLATQDKWQATVAAVQGSVSEMLVHARQFGVKRIGMPAIGAGLGGLDWADVKAVLQKAGDSTDIELVCFETFVP